jgi:F0F1-type ATP synthase epsilon subunit
MASDKRIMVQVFSPAKILFTGSAVAVTSLNEKGRFDVLPFHANFISIVKKYLIIHPDRKNRQKIDIKTGVLHCKNNVVKVFVDITGEPADVQRS